MAKLLQADILDGSVGLTVKNKKGKTLGEVTEVTYGDSKDQPEYIIIKSKWFYGEDDRFFAIPASTTLASTNDDDDIVLKITENDLRLAKRIPANQCPKPSMQFAQPIYELYRYQEPER